MSKERNDTLLIIPAYNEGMNIGKVLNGLIDAGLNKKMDILVINDGSSDDTSERAREAEGIIVLDQIYNMGYGAALQTGYKYAVEKDYSYLIQMDADGQHDLVNVERILARLKGESGPSGLPPHESVHLEEDRLPDIIIGSRFLKGSQTFKISGLKKFAIGLFKKVITTLTGYRLTDPTSGLHGLNRRAFEYYAGYSNFDIYYPDLNMIIQMILLGYHIEEIPAVMHEREAGVSMHSSLLKAGKYMLIMAISTSNSYARYHREFKKRRKANR